MAYDQHRSGLGRQVGVCRSCCYPQPIQPVCIIANKAGATNGIFKQPLDPGAYDQHGFRLPIHLVIEVCIARHQLLAALWTV